MRPILTAVVALCLAARPAVAHNNYFLPGDAFFSVAISQKLIVEWMKSEKDHFEFEYERFDGEFFACGNIGYTALEVEGITPGLRKALGEAYWRFAAFNRPEFKQQEYNGRQVLEQTNSVVALIYNKEFDPGTTPMGLKLNENWKDEGAGRYCGFVDSAKAVMLDWKLAADIPPLHIREKLDAHAHLQSYEAARTIDKPLHIHADDIQIVLVGFAKNGATVHQTCPELKDIFDDDQQRSARCMVVTKDLIRLFERDEKGSWEETKINLPVPANESQIPEKLPKEPVVPE